MRFFYRRGCRSLLITIAVCFGLSVLYSQLASLNSNPVNSLSGRRESNSLLTKSFIDTDVYEERLKRYMEYFKAEPFRKGPGEQGAGVMLSEAEKKSLNYDAMFQKEAFNKISSDRISLDRALGDFRSPQCKSIKYPVDLPTASVIIIFHEEAWSSLMRTAHSVVNRTPPRYLKEVVLLDDFSTKEHLLKHLDDYVKKTFPDGVVRVVRSKERLGLIRARLEGAKAAVGDVIIFLDSHCEVTRGWAEPILARIKESRSAVLCPIIESISAHDISYYGGYGGSAVGSFWWSGHFTWDSVPQHEMKRRKADTDPIRSPTMAGGLFAADRKYFFEVGAYDEGMGIWGGENLEISFRVWMCGGTLEFIPCSHVGHIFRASHPYTFPGRKDYHGFNTMRLVDVWLDEYKRLFYMHRRDLLSKTKERGNITDRFELRKRLKCNSFQWYLDNVIPEKFIPDSKRDVIAYGMLRNPTTNWCIDLLNYNEFDRMPTAGGVYNCQGGASGRQIFSYSHKQEIRREWGCLDCRGSMQAVEFITCSGSPTQKWKLDKAKKKLIHVSSGNCLTTEKTSPGKAAMVSPCQDNPHQVWEFEFYL